MFSCSGTGLSYICAWYLRKYNAKQKQPGCKKVRGQSEATMVINDQKL